MSYDQGFIEIICLNTRQSNIDEGQNCKITSNYKIDVIIYCNDVIYQISYFDFRILKFYFQFLIQIIDQNNCTIMNKIHDRYETKMMHNFDVCLNK